MNIQDEHRKHMMKGILKKWFYYHNRTQTPLKTNHSDFIGILGILEEYSNQVLGETPDTWQRIKNGIDKLNYDQTEFIYLRVCRFKSEGIRKFI